MYPTPTWPASPVAPLVTTGAPRPTLNDTTFWPLPDMLLAPRVTLLGPLTALGVPEITPVPVFSERPVGRTPASTLKLVGEFVAVIV